ncbi:hypothetical protein LTR17_018177 [Elasticomyces elasticus]|nr:hypothetical protein LTR17_018177 [Elasticomyces elasticus]
MATDAPERSPSPTPIPPTAAAPGPRATALHQLYNDAITHILKTCSYSHFAACFPTPSRAVAGSIKNLYGQFIDKLGEQLRRNFDVLIRDRDAVAALNGLDRLVDGARARRRKAEEAGIIDKENTVAPHTLPPQTLYRSHLAPSLVRHSQQIKAEHAAVQAENEEIMARVQQQRKDIAALLSGLETVVAEVDAKAAALNPGDLDELRQETRAVDEGMRMEM